MVGLNSSLYIGLTGVRTAQVGLNTTGNNIGNINTPGYSRQMPVIEIKGNTFSQGLTIGTGSDVQRIMAMREPLADKAITRYEGANSFFDELAQGLHTIEGLMVDGENSGVGYAVNELFMGLERATVRPTDLAVREELLALAKNAVQEINNRDSDLVNEQLRVNLEVEDIVNRVNQLTENIARINQQISGLSKPAEDLIDQRKMAIDELSQLVGVETFDLPNNMIQVNIQNSNQILVGRELRNELGVQVNPASSEGFFDVTLRAGTTTSVITPSIQNGNLGAKLQIRDTEIGQTRQNLDLLAAGLIIQFNNIHQTGTDLNGNTNLRFFDPDNATALGATAIGTVDPTRYQGLAGSLSLSSDLVDPLNPTAGFDPTRIALSATGSAGDNGVGVQLAALRDSVATIDADRDGDPTNDPATTFERFYGRVVGDIGQRVRRAETDNTTADELLNQAKLRRDDASGVNLDEEAANLTQYQRAFEASSRFINVINQLTGEIISRLGS